MNALQTAENAKQAVSAVENAAAGQQQQLQDQLQELNAANSKLREQLAQLNSDSLDLKGQLEVQTTQVDMLEAREKQHEQQLHDQVAKLKEKVAEIERMAKQLQV